MKGRPSSLFPALPVRGWAAAVFFAAVAAGHAQTQSQEQSDVETIANNMNGYNLIAFGTATDSSYDIEGGVAAEDFTAQSAVIEGENMSASLPSFYLGGSGSALTGTVTLDSGFASTPNLTSSQWTWSGQTLSNGSNSLHENGSGSQESANPITGGNPTVSLSTIQSNITSAANSLAGASATGTFSVSNNDLVLSTSITSGVAVFTMTVGSGSSGSDTFNSTANEYNGESFNNITISVPAGVNYVINVVDAGGDTLFQGVGFGSGTDDDQLLWNFGETTGTITLDNNNTFEGTIVAPDASIVQSSSTISGEVVADNFTQGAELDTNNFQAAVVTTPEPATYALWAVGLCAAGAALRRIRRNPLPLGRKTSLA